MKLRNERKLRKFSRNILALVLSVAIIGTGSGISTLAGSADFRKETAEEVVEKVKLDKDDYEPPEIVKEIKKERTENSNTYLMSDGSKKLEVYPYPVRYKENGKFVNYDNELIPLENNAENPAIVNKAEDNAYEYVNATSDSKHYFADEVSETTPIIISKDDYVVSFTPQEDVNENDVNTASTASAEIVDNCGYKLEKVNGNVAEYKNDELGIEINYRSLSSGVKEDIVLSKKPKENTISFVYDAEGLVWEQNKKAGTISLKDGKKTVGEILAPYICDAKGNYSFDDVEYVLETNGEQCIVTVVIDEEYLDNATYPVVIDPTFVWTKEDGLSMATIKSSSPDTASSLFSNMLVGNLGGTTNYSALVMMDGLQNTIKGKHVQNCSINLVVNSTSYNPTINVYPITEAWNPESVTWNNQPDTASQYICSEYIALNGYNDVTYKFDITDWVCKIASGQIDYYHGFMFSGADGNNTLKYALIWTTESASDVPAFEITYSDAIFTDATYNGDFELNGEYDEESGCTVSWDEYSESIDRYEVYTRVDNGTFELVNVVESPNAAEGESESQISANINIQNINETIDIRVMSVDETSGNNYLSDIVSFQKYTDTSIDDEGNEVTEIYYEQATMDTDEDDLEDGYEIWDFKTLWNLGYTSESSEEILYDLDSDNDGFPDSYEVFTLGTNPASDSREGARDDDGDGLTNLEEYQKGTDPHLVDSDFDGTNDNGESKADARYTENSTSELKALNAEVYIGLYDYSFTETEDGATITRIVNVYSGTEKKVSYNYGNTNLNKEKLYFYDENQNNTAVIEKINTYDAEDSSENEKNVICITYAYDDNGNNILICDQKTRYTMAYDADGEMTEIKVGDISLMKYSGQILQDNATSEGDTENIAVGGIINISEKTEEYGNGQRIRTVTTLYKTEDESEEIRTVEEESIDAIATKTEMFYNEDTQASYIAEYNAEEELMRFTDYTNGINSPVVYSYTTSGNVTTVSRSDGFTKTVTNTEDEVNSISTDSTVYTFKDIKGTNRTYTQAVNVDTSEDSDINMNSVMYSGDKSEYVFEYENDITTKRIYAGQSDAVKLSMVETHSSATNATYAITDADGSRTLTYTYDLAGNITEIREGSTVKKRYVYDGHGRLLKETDFTENVEHEYVYNSTGNIKAHKVYAISENGTVATTATQEIYFTHENTSWPDRMTKYNGQNLTYDSSGNPLTYRDGLTFTWTRGRMLENVKLNGTSVASYKYNTEGLRIYKDTSDSTTVYEWDNANLVRETITYKQGNKGKYDIWYMYDGIGELYGFVYEYLNEQGNVERKTVYYEKNIQGDVIALLNADAERIAEYSYDAWGNVTESTCEAGYELPYSLNHIGYRGYYKDNETELYYLQSRYYDSVTCRFINADDVSMLGETENIISKDNLYIYCNSNPIVNIDPDGKLIVIDPDKPKNVLRKSVWMAAKAYLSYEGYDLSKNMFYHALYGEGKDLSNTNRKKLTKKIKRNKRLKRTISKRLKKYQNAQTKKFSIVLRGYEFTKNKDLYYSIQHVNIQVEARKISDNRWKIKVKVKDIYDFTEMREWSSFANLANNVGYSMQKAGALIPYKWTVKYSYKCKYLD